MATTLERTSNFRASTLTRVAKAAKKLEFTGYKTLDFEEPDNLEVREHYRGQKVGNRISQEFLEYTHAAVLSLFICAIYLALFFGTEEILHLRIESFTQYIDEKRYLDGFFVALATCVVAAIVPALLVIYVAPDVIGSGMTQVIAFLNGSANIKSVTLTTTVVRTIGVFGMVVAGLYAGIDGPMAQVGSNVGILLTQFIRRSHRLRRVFYGEASKEREKTEDIEADYSKKSASTVFGWKGLLSFLEQKKLRLYATIGASAAIAAVFRSPIGGVMFALEEASSYFEPSILIRTTFATVLTYVLVTYTIVLGSAEGHGTDQEHYSTLDYFSSRLSVHFPSKVHCGPPIHVEDFLAYILMGILAALIGNIWNWLLSSVQKLRIKYIIRPSDTAPGKFVRLLEVLCVCVITTTITVLLPVAPGVDECTMVNRPMTHVLSATPKICFNAKTVSEFRSCMSRIDQVCLPTDLAEQYQWNILVQHLESRNITGEGLTNDATAEDVAIFHHESGSGRFHSLTRNVKKFRVKSAKPSSSKLFRRGSAGSDDEEDVKERIKKAMEPVLRNANADMKKVPYYLYTKDGLQGNPDQGCYYQLRSLLYASPEKQLKLLLKRGLYNLWSGRALGFFVLTYIGLTCLTYYIALPTDMVIPNLIIGAVAGRQFGLLVNLFKMKAGRMVEDPGTWAMFGMAAAWAGTSRLVLTVTIVCLELTSDFNNIPGLLVVTLSAAWVAKFLGPSMYHQELENNGAPYLDHEPPAALHSRSIERAINRTQKLIWLTPEEPLYRIRDLCATTPYAGFPVVDVVERSTPGQGKKMLLHPIGYVLTDRLKEALAYISQTTTTTKEGGVVGRGAPDPMTFLNIAALMNVSPTIVRKDAVASKVYRTMRHLGLKTVLVVNRAGYLVGIVSRKDLIRLSHVYSDYHRPCGKKEKVDWDDDSSVDKPFSIQSPRHGYEDDHHQHGLDAVEVEHDDEYPWVSSAAYVPPQYTQDTQESRHQPTSKRQSYQVHEQICHPVLGCSPIMEPIQEQPHAEHEARAELPSSRATSESGETLNETSTSTLEAQVPGPTFAAPTASARTSLTLAAEYRNSGVSDVVVVEDDEVVETTPLTTFQHPPYWR
ncbi:hypothetical protein HK102_003600 [Quaeritorhiza haematococci]|nr:hypothetical protein HK102_003600 [Quaeritorhiza haematococci]